MSMKLYIGCSGWQYREWKGIFYPLNLPQSRWFEHYQKHFNTVEINNTFYRFPQESYIEKWRDMSPKGFKFSLKVPRFITHLHKFIDTEQEIKEFYRLLAMMGEKLGCVLFQLPARFVYHSDCLRRMVEQMDPSFHNVIEFRDKSWWREEVYQTLRKAKIGFCHISTPANLPEQLIPSRDFYLRMHGTDKWFEGSYTDAQLKRWIDQIKESGASQAWVYFNNTAQGAAVNNAQRLMKLVKVCQLFDSSFQSQ